MPPQRSNNQRGCRALSPLETRPSKGTRPAANGVRPTTRQGDVTARQHHLSSSVGERFMPTRSQKRQYSGQRWWARVAMAVLPLAVHPLGYSFRVGRGPAFSRDARHVLQAVWSAPPDDLALHRRYLESPTWVLGYRHGRPIACMGLYDVRELSFSLNHLQAAPPHGVDPATYRDLSRLAIVRSARGGAQIVMLGLLREMVLWCQAHGVTHILSISVPKLFPVFKRYNPSAKLITLDPAPIPPSDDVRAYHDRIAARVGPVISYTFDLNGFDALGVMLRTFARPFRRRQQIKP